MLKDLRSRLAQDAANDRRCFNDLLAREGLVDADKETSTSDVFAVAEPSVGEVTIGRMSVDRSTHEAADFYACLLDTVSD
jgi:hypothetical protein